MVIILIIFYYSKNLRIFYYPSYFSHIVKLLDWRKKFSTYYEVLLKNLSTTFIIKMGFLNFVLKRN